AWNNTVRHDGGRSAPRVQRVESTGMTIDLATRRGGPYGHTPRLGGLLGVRLYAKSYGDLGNGTAADSVRERSSSILDRSDFCRGSNALRRERHGHSYRPAL